MDATSLPIIDLDVFLNSPRDGQDVLQECKKVRSLRLLCNTPITENLQAADALITFGALIVQDSRISEDDNNTFLDLLEDYFNQPIDALKADERPELGFQVGVTLENTEKPKCAVDEPCLRVIERLELSERPVDITAHSPDPKCRFFWKMSEAPPYETEFPALNAANVVPQNEDLAKRWTPTMEKWGKSMKEACVFDLLPRICKC